jgi:DeoR family transcriptional regulator, fructose operon transcriptional repressor
VKPTARKQLILDHVASGEVVSIDDLIEATGASPSTVRRDIRALEATGQIVSLQGGAIRSEDRATELPAATKSLINRAEKAAIAVAAAAIVRDGDTIYVDSGTTATEFMRALRDVRAHVVTSNTQVLALKPDPKVTITAVGGDFLPDIGSIAGTITDRQLSELYFDKAFIGVTGISESAGVTTFDIREANKKRIVLEHSRETYVLADSSKFGTISVCRAFALQDCAVITDAHADFLAAARDVIVAEP